MEEELSQLLNTITSNKNIKSKKLDGICLSETAPKNTNVLWIQYNSENKFTLNIYWCNHWHPICSEESFNEIIKRLKQLFNTNDTRLIQMISSNLKKVTYIDDYIDIDINPLNDNIIDNLLREEIQERDGEQLMEVVFTEVYAISLDNIITLWNEIKQQYDTES